MKTATLTLLLLAVMAPGANAKPDPHPSCAEAHRAAFLTMDSYATNLDGQLHVGPCDKRGQATTVTRIRVAGGVRPERFRLWITLDTDGSYSVRARPIYAGKTR